MQTTNVLSFAGLLLVLAVSASLGWTALWAAPVVGVATLGLRAMVPGDRSALGARSSA